MDAGRKSAGDKMSDKMTPDNSKSTTGKIGDAVTDAGDKIQRDVVPDSQKSSGQAAQDKMGREKDAHKSNPGEPSMLDKAKDTLGMGKK